MKIKFNINPKKIKKFCKYQGVKFVVRKDMIIGSSRSIFRIIIGLRIRSKSIVKTRPGNYSNSCKNFQINNYTGNRSKENIKINFTLQFEDPI